MEKIRLTRAVRILIVSQYFWPENFRINDLTRELVRRGHSVTVLTGIPNYPTGSVFDEYKQAPEIFTCYHGAAVLRVPIFPRGTRLFQLLLNYLSFVLSASILGPWRLRNICVDVIFVFEPSPVTVGLPAILMGKVKRAPVVFWALDLWPETLVAMGVLRSRSMLKCVASMVRFIYARCDLVLGQSQGFLLNIAKYCSDKRKIRYFPSWAEDVFRETDISYAPEIPIQEGVFNIVFAGNIGEAQDMPAVLDAAEKLKHDRHIRWVFIGDGRKLSWVRDEVERRGMQENILMLGRFPIERMPSFYAHADALLVSLKKNPVFDLTIPGKIQSYLMAGIPLLGMLDGEGAAVIRNAHAGFTCSAGDSLGLVKAVQTMTQMSLDGRHQLGANGRAFAQTEFDRTMLIDRLDAWLHEAAQQHGEKRKMQRK